MEPHVYDVVPDRGTPHLSNVSLVRSKGAMP
ncbi:hypothetical protein C8E86_0443 [Catellatospora citrea]|nr:hypothetical protein C8E86_0443 [Catellatospora citrea]